MTDLNTNILTSFSSLKWENNIICSLHQFLFHESEILNCILVVRSSIHPSIIYPPTLYYLLGTVLGPEDIIVGHDENDSCFYKGHCLVRRQLWQSMK